MQWSNTLLRKNMESNSTLNSSTIIAEALIHLPEAMDMREAILAVLTAVCIP